VHDPPAAVCPATGRDKRRQRREQVVWVETWRALMDPIGSGFARLDYAAR
jgi:hypothetical protein